MAQVFEVVKTNDDNTTTSYGMYKYERQAIRECKEFNDDIIMRLTREIATLNGAIRGQGKVRMSEIRTILMNMPFNVKTIRLNDRY
jgi:hypothetical protein